LKSQRPYKLWACNLVTFLFFPEHMTQFYAAPSMLIWILLLLIINVKCFSPWKIAINGKSKINILHGIGVGVDLGTTNSAVSILNGGIPVILEIEGNGRTLPSIVCLEEGNVIVGKDAIEREFENPFTTYRNVKRVIGTGEEAARRVAKVVPNLAISTLPKMPKKSHKYPRKNRKADNSQGLLQQILDAQQNPIQFHGPADKDGVRTLVSPEYISSQILRKLFETAEAHTGQKVDRAVIGVPAYFHDEQRDATIRACQMAGVDKVKLLREPEAAALSYGVGKEQLGDDYIDELVLVFDLGGGTYDVSMLVVDNGLTEVISTSGNVYLGGSDFDYRIAEHFNFILRKHGLSVSILDLPVVKQSMIRAAEMVRIHLSNNRKTQLTLPFTLEGWTTLNSIKDLISSDIRDDVTSDGIKVEDSIIIDVSRNFMESLCLNELRELLRPIREVAIISGALLPGDTSPTAAEAAFALEEEMSQEVQEREMFFDFYDDQESENNFETLSSDTLLQLKSFDIKASKKAQQKGRKKARDIAKAEKRFRVERRKIDSRDIQVKVERGINGRPISQVVLVGGATRMPAIGKMIQALTGVVPQRTVNPDEAVALGCAIQVGLLDGNEDLGRLTVLTPMQAAILRALATPTRNGVTDNNDPDFDDFDADFEEEDISVIEFDTADD
jgi:molecular chaperone DnaK (HSP70)